MPHKARILYVCAESLAEGAAAHVHVNEIMAGLGRRGWDCQLIDPAYGRNQWSRPGVIGRFLGIVSVNFRAWRQLDSVDAVYCRAHPILVPVAWAAKRRGITVVQECNGPYADIVIAHPWMKRFFGVISGMQRWQYVNADGVVTVTRKLADWLDVERGRADVKVVPNAANTDVFTPFGESAPPVAKPYVAFWGALAAWHGVPTMLAAKAHRDWPEGVNLVIIGAGAQSASIEAAIAQGQKITYLGRRPYKQIPELVRGALAGLVTIEDVSGRGQTGSALKLYETLAAGLPAIVTDYPAQTEIIREHRCGIIIPPGDPSALAAAVAEMVRDPDAAKAMGERGRKAVVAEHSWDHRAGEIDKLLRGLVRARR